jgi:hypothetical protein
LAQPRRQGPIHRITMAAQDVEAVIKKAEYERTLR